MSKRDATRKMAPLSIAGIYGLTKDILEYADLLSEGNDVKIVANINECLAFLETDVRQALLKYFDLHDIKWFRTPSDVMYGCLSDENYQAEFPPMAEGNALFLICNINEYHVVKNIKEQEDIICFKEQIKELSLLMSQYKAFEYEQPGKSLKKAQSKGGKVSKAPILICALIGEMIENEVKQATKIKALEVWKKLKKIADNKNQFKVKNITYSLSFEIDHSSDKPKEAGKLVQSDDKFNEKRIGFDAIQFHIGEARKHFQKKSKIKSK